MYLGLLVSPFFSHFSSTQNGLKWVKELLKISYVDLTATVMVANRLKLANYHCQNGNRQADVSRSRYVKAVSTLDANLSTMLKPDDWLKHFLNCNGPTHRAL